MEKYAEASREIDTLRDEVKVPVLKKAKIIGCTTTSAAKHSDLIAMTGVTTVIVEEAAEILEAHVLTTVPHNAKRLVLIGDHLQLRAKLEHYPLRKESGKHVDFDVSLFERLVLQTGFPSVQLNVQHRMRPEISSVVRQTTYPTLLDHKSVLNRDNIRGLSSNMVFVSHTHLELDKDESDVLGSASKSNEYEADMAVATVKYLIKQGYRSEDIVLLTPYLGQLVLLESKLKAKRITSDISDLDRGDLTRAHLRLDDSGRGSSGDQLGASVRFATIDNFQGEESKIIIANLVRSNEAGVIGFLSSAERVNVLCSRAQDGFIIIGNATCFRNARSERGRALWNGILDRLEGAGQLRYGLPVVCERHSNEQLISTPDSFNKNCQHGGCSLPCSVPLPSCPHGHPCPKKCHPMRSSSGKDAHEGVLCRFKMEEQCENGHIVYRECHKLEAEPCRAIVSSVCAFGHVNQHLCFEKTFKTCKACGDIAREKERLEQENREQEKLYAREIAKLEHQQVQADLRIQKENRKRDHNARLLRLEKEEKYRALEAARLSEEQEGRSTRQLTELEPIPSPSLSPAGEPVAARIDTSIDVDENTCLMKIDADIPTQLPPVRQSLGRSPSPLKYLETLFISIDKDDWIQVYEFTMALSSSTKSIELFAIALLNRLAKLHLGDDVVEIQSEVTQITSKAEAMLDSLATKDKVHDLLYSIVTYVGMKVESTDGQFPWTAVNLAKRFLGYASKDKAVPTAWIDEAQTIAKGNDLGAVRKQVSKVSTAADKWAIQKTMSGQKPLESLDALMKMTGLEEVKASILSELFTIRIAQEQGRASGASSYNSIFEGSPGTGKTTVARHYAKFLIELEILPSDSIFEETSGSELINGGVSAAKKILERVKEAGGGVVFLDEAYQLSPKDSQRGREVLDFILTHSERFNSEYGPLVWIFAGYSKKMEKLFEHNPGLPSRFPTKLRFADYSDEELLSIFSGLLENLPPESTQKTASKPKARLNKVIPIGNASDGGGTHSRHSLRPDGATEVDEWGNTWTWEANSSTFRDEYGNITGLGATSLGQRGNPLVSTADGSAWLYDRSRCTWTNDSGKSSPLYPGKPVPIAAVPPSKPFVVANPKHARIAIRRLGRKRGTEGFGNARAVRILFDLTRKRQSNRLTAAREKGFTPNVMEFSRDDLLGPRADEEALRSSKAWDLLQGMEGLKEVKEEIGKLLQLVILNAELEENEEELREVSLNRIFLGNPGTGKTTVAKLYGQILTDLGLLSKGEVHLKNPSDFIGSALGSSETQTRAILAAAEGCVLVIDEAHSLNPSVGVGTGGGGDPYKTAVIDTIVEQVQGVPGDDRAVILLGYKKPMEAFMAAANPGLSRRFQMERAIQFQDYDDTALVRILRKICEKKGLSIDLKTASYAVKQLAKARELPNFGNAGAVANLLSMAILSQGDRVSGMSSKKDRSTLTEEDFVGFNSDPVRDDDLFRGLIGCRNVIDKMKELQYPIQLCKSQGKDYKKFCEYNFLFVGGPGTGKTTVANRMGEMFYHLGLLPSYDVVETSASDLTTGFAGQAGKQTHDVLHKARGKVLFIDEAYQLNPKRGGAFMQEVVDELVKALTSEELKHRIVVILAGYDDMLQVNEGLKSRFSEKLYFENFTTENVCELLLALLSKETMTVSAGALTELPQLSEKLIASESFANGRDVTTWFKRIFREYAKRMASSTGGCEEVTADDLTCALDNLLASKDASVPKRKVEEEGRAFQSEKQTTSSSHRTVKLVTETVTDRRSDQVESIEDGINDGTDAFLSALQSVLDSMGLNTQDGVRSLARLSVDSAEMQELASKLSVLTDTSIDSAFDKLLGWKSQQEDVRAKVEEQEKEIALAKEQKRKAWLPIWRCRVCGRADKPYIACYVAPFIVRYEEVEVSDM